MQRESAKIKIYNKINLDKMSAKNEKTIKFKNNKARSTLQRY